MKKILYFCKNISLQVLNDYVSASYQIDFLNKMSEKFDLVKYGPGYPNYNEDDQYQDIINKINFRPDFIVFGHNWLSDNANDKVISLMPKLNLKKIKVTKILILNKEYVNLEKKISFIKNNSFDLVFSHHHDTKKYASLSGVKFEFLPFACSERFLNKSDRNKNIDIFFSGVLKNLNKNSNQTDFRINCQKKIFYTLFDEPIIKKKDFKNYNVVWNSVPRFLIGKIIKKIKKNRLFHYDMYPEVMQSAKMTICSLSPMGLISPRFFEAMISKSLVLTENSNLYSNIFDQRYFVTLNSDASDLIEKVKYYSNNSNKLRVLTEKAHTYIKNNHTWNNRLNYFEKKIIKI